MKNKIIRITTVPESLYKLMEGQLKFMNEYFEVVGVASPGKAVDKVIANEGIRIQTIKMTRTISPVSDLFALWKLARFIHKEKPTIIHTHTPKAGILGMLSGWICRVPIRMHTIAGLPLLETKGFKRLLLKFVEKVTCSCATNVYPNSLGLKELIIRYKLCSLSKLNVIANGSSNGINTKYFSRDAVLFEQTEILKERFLINKEDFVFIFIGRLVKDKGINELVSAFDKLNKHYKNIKLFLIGTEEILLDPLKKNTIETIKNNSDIIQVGFQDDVRPFLAISDVLVFPTYREGFPNVPMQAGSMGLPSIVTDINGCNEIVIQGENGIIIPPKDEQALFDAMKSVLLNKSDLKNMASNARSMIISRYEQKMVWEAMLNIYNGEIKNKLI